MGGFPREDDQRSAVQRYAAERRSATAARTDLMQFFKVASLQSEFCTKDFFRATNFLTKNAPKFSPKILSLCSVDQKNPLKIPSKFPTKFSKFPCEKSKKIHRRASAGAQGKQFCRQVKDKIESHSNQHVSQSLDLPLPHGLAPSETMV